MRGYHTVIRDKPNNTKALAELARLYERTGNTAKAKEYVERAMRTARRPGRWPDRSNTQVSIPILASQSAEDATLTKENRPIASRPDYVVDASEAVSDSPATAPIASIENVSESLDQLIMETTEPTTAPPAKRKYTKRRPVAQPPESRKTASYQQSSWTARRQVRINREQEAQRTEREVVEITWERMQELEPEMREGDIEAEKEWMTHANTLIEIFKAFRLFYPLQKFVRFLGYSAHARRRALETSMPSTGSKAKPLTEMEIMADRLDLNLGTSSFLF